MKKGNNKNNIFVEMFCQNISTEKNTSNKSKGFTLVELIIVITVIAILFTIAYVSFKNYVKDARDGTRVTTIGNIQSGLEIESTVTGKYPDPDKKDGQTLLQTGALSISGSIIEYSYLGVVGDSVTRQLSLTKVPQDPLTGDKYIYTKTIDGKKYQIASILENPTSYKNNLIKQVNAGNDGYVAKVEGNHKDIVIKKVGTGSYITVVPSLVFDGSGSNILNQTGTLSIVNNKGNLPYSPSKSLSIGNTTTAEKLIREIRNNELATVATLKLPDGVTLDGSGVLNEWWIPNKNGTNWNTYSSGVILASLGSVGVDGGVDYTKLTAILNGWSIPETTTTQVVTAPSYDIGNSLRFNGSNQYLSRTPSSVGNRQKFTFSAWVKRTQLGTVQSIFSSTDLGIASNRDILFFNSDDTLNFALGNGVGTFITSKALYRDVSSWYNIVLVLDIQQSILSNRVKIYVNGVLVEPTSSSIYPSSTSYTTQTLNTGLEQLIGGAYSVHTHVGNYYLSDVYFVDGETLSPTSFGQFDSNGRWTPKSYTGSYGTNGFHLDFSSGASLTSLGLDSSGKGNNWTLSPTFNTYDQMLDSPTNNFATLNPLDWTQGTDGIYTNGNLTNKVTNTTGRGGYSTISIPNKGKWYFEVTYDSLNCSQGQPVTSLANPDKNNNFIFGIGCESGGGYLYRYNSGNSVGYTLISAGDYFMFAIDRDNNKAWLGKNGTWLNSGDPYNLLNPTENNLPSGIDYLIYYQNRNGSQSSFNFGQSNWKNSIIPSGFKALSTKNITYPIENPKQYFDVLTYTGNGTSQSLTGLNFKPDLVWIKRRSGGNSHHVLQDSVRGTYKFLFSSSTDPENTNANADWFQSFNNDGFSVKYTSSGGVNTNEWNLASTPYVAWNWRAGGTSVTNNDGTIQSQVSVNKDAGFSIVKYTGNGTAGATVGHLLGKTPSFIILKRTDNGTDNWRVYHSALGGTKALALNTTDGAGTNNIIWNNANPNDLTFTLGTESNTNASGSLIISYVWSEVPGYSKFGNYTGNGSSTGDGPFVYTGFKPKFVMVKRVDTTSTVGWLMWDGVRNTFNPIFSTLKANLPNSETGDIATPPLDYLSNGFKLRDPGSDFNSLGGTYIYAAFAELPFK